MTKEEYTRLNNHSPSNLFRNSSFTATLKADKEVTMKKYLILTMAVLMSLLVGMPVMAQLGPGFRMTSLGAKDPAWAEA